MVGLDHGPGEPAEAESVEFAVRNARYGLVLFFVYLVVYGSFVGINAFRPEWMDATPLAGINLAILSGFGLIGLALVMALLYGWLCRDRVAPPAPPEEPAER